MYDQGAKKYSRENAGGKSAAAKADERRSADRHVVTASAEVIELGSGARFSTRTTDLGPGGCFVDTMVPFPVGSKVQVRVRKDKTDFETGGIVVYSQAGLGMGIAFDTMKPNDRQALDDWLTEFTGGKQAAFRESMRAPGVPGPNPGLNQAALVRLVQLMIGKGILTESEGSSVFHDPVL